MNYNLVRLDQNGERPIAMGLMSYFFKYNVQEYTTWTGKKVIKCDYTLECLSLVVSDPNLIKNLHAKVVPR